MTDYVTLLGVPIVSVGTWHASTGDITITAADLASAVEASNDPGLSVPRGKKGHGRTKQGEPAVGVFTNLRVSDDGQTLLADHTLTAETAATLAEEYPGRSIEAWFDVTSPATDKTYGCYIDAVALLGVETPACAALPDLTPDDVAAATAAAMGGRYVAASVANIGRSLMGTRTLLQVASEDIRRQFYAQIGDRNEWWIRQELRDPDEIICESWDGGEFYSVPYTIAGDAITFGEPAALTLQPAPADAQVAASRARLTASFTSRSESRPPTTNEETTMANAAVNARLGLSEDATEEETLAALDALASAGTTTDDAETETTDEETAEPVAASSAGFQVPEGFTALPTDRLKALEEGAELARKTHDASEQARKDGKVALAKSEGRISHAESEHIQKWMRADEAACDAFLATRPKGTIPVTGELGTSAGEDADGVSDDAFNAYFSASFPGAATSKGA